MRCFWRVVHISCLMIALFHKYNKVIKNLLYHHNLCLWFVTEAELDVDKKFDAFLCFASLDDSIIDDVIEGLEKGPDAFNLCVCYRDWIAGDSIHELVSRKKL